MPNSCDMLAFTGISKTAFEEVVAKKNPTTEKSSEASE